MEKKIAIIGAGLAGLAAGCYGRMNGYDTEIFESRSLPGGLCTSWKRNGYVIDGCIWWLTGSGPGHYFYSVWQELGAIQGRKIYDPEVFETWIGQDGKDFHVYTDADRLERHMIEFSPVDEPATRELCRLIRKFGSFRMDVGKPAELMNFFDKVMFMFKFAPYRKDFAMLARTSLSDFGARFSNPLLREAVTGSMHHASLPLFALVWNLAKMDRKAGGFPLGGSLEFARGIEKRYLGLGGKVRYNSRVVKITETSGRATGVELENGERVTADYVISAADMKRTLFSMLDGTRLDPLHKLLFDDPRLYPPCVLVNFGVNMDFTPYGDRGIWEFLRLEKPVELAGKTYAWLNVHNYAFDPSLAPEHKTVAQTYLPSDGSYWERFRNDQASYSAEKDRIAAICADRIEERYPGFKARIEMTDVATPLTFEQYTLNWRGNYMTWLLSWELRQKYRYIPKTVPGLENFWLASMWTNPPGGTPQAAAAGREVIQLLCRRDRKKFRTTTV